MRKDWINRLPHWLIYYGYRFFLPKRFATQQARRKKLARKNENSLRGFDEYQCIFVHIPKAAGVSLSNNLFGDLGGGHIPIYHYYIVYSPSELKS